jgi:hypothetical protein
MNSSWGFTSPLCTFFSIQLQNWILCGASTDLNSPTTPHGWAIFSCLRSRAVRHTCLLWQPSEKGPKANLYLRLNVKLLICQYSFLVMLCFMKHWPCGPPLLSKAGHERFCGHRWIKIFEDEFPPLSYVCFKDENSLICSVHQWL